MLAQQKYTPVQPSTPAPTPPYFCTYMPTSSVQFPTVQAMTALRQVASFARNWIDDDDEDDEEEENDGFFGLIDDFVDVP